VLVIEPRASALGPSRALRKRLLLATALALAGALGLAALGASRVVRPLSELTAALGGLTRGPATPRPVPVRSDDEIGALARAFNQMAEELERAQRDLVDAERFALVGELASGVAHEVRTSLGVLHSAVQLLERSLPARADARLSELALMVREEVDRLGRVVSDLLTLQRGRPLRLEPALLSQPLARALELVRPQAEAKGIGVASRLGPNPEPRVECEPELIQQVAVNLLVNATQALDAGGHIDVAVLGAEGGYGGFEVRDDGPGIPEVLRDRIFAPFVTGRPGGIGLGLTFVKRVIHDHRGRVDVESGAGAGTRICIRLPLAEAAP
jgi:signal transduction histidine kinase